MSNKTDLSPKSSGGAAEGSGSADNGGGGPRSSDVPAAPSHSSSAAGEGKGKSSESKDKDKAKDGEQEEAGEADPSRACCFCWCCCCSCSCLTVKNNEENPLQKDKNFSDILNGDEPMPSIEEVRSWGESFDRLMRSSAGRKVFREFLKCEYSEENILFWAACEELKNVSNPSLVEPKARQIYDNYVSTLSPKEVSLDSRVRNIIDDNMKEPTIHTFDDAQVQIYTLMHRDSYPRFVSSSTYRRLAQLNSTSRKESMA